MCKVAGLTQCRDAVTEPPFLPPNAVLSWGLQLHWVSFLPRTHLSFPESRFSFLLSTSDNAYSFSLCCLCPGATRKGVASWFPSLHSLSLVASWVPSITAGTAHGSRCSCTLPALCQDDAQQQCWVLLTPLTTCRRWAGQHSPPRALSINSPCTRKALSSVFCCRYRICGYQDAFNLSL